MQHRLLSLFLLLLLVSGTGIVMAHAQAGSRSIVIGRLNGTLYKPPHFLPGNSRNVGGDRGSVEIRGFKLVRRSDGRSFTIRPLGDGYFKQSLPPGEYSLIRQRWDRPSYREDKMTMILPFTVPANSLVNLGTLEIVLQGKPEQLMYHASRPSKGIYIYRYRYVRLGGDEASSAPLEWFTETKPGTAVAYADSIVMIKREPAAFMDSSRFTLGQSKFRLIPFN